MLQKRHLTAVVSIVSIACCLVALYVSENVISTTVLGPEYFTFDKFSSYAGNTNTTSKNDEINTTITIKTNVTTITNYTNSIAPHVHQLIPVVKTKVYSYEKIPKDITEKAYLSTTSCGNRKSTSSAGFSKLSINKIDKEKIIVTVSTFDQGNKRKTIGGDEIALWAEQVRGNGRVSGRVKDNLNGSYTGTIPLVWNGLTKIRAKFLSLTEETCLRLNALHRYGNIMYSNQKPGGISAYFIKNGISEKTRCGPSADIYGYKYFCNFTEFNDNTSWYCGEPFNLLLCCDDMYYFLAEPFRLIDIKVKPDEKLEFKGFAVFNHSLTVKFKNNKHKNMRLISFPCRDANKTFTWTRYLTSGYFASTWKPVYCYGSKNHSFTSYRKCINGKNIIMLGDSTVRQYYMHLCENVFLNSTCLLHKSIFGTNMTYHSDWVINAYNASLLYRKHELPYFNRNIKPNKIKSTPSMIKDIADGTAQDDSLVVMVNYFAHFLEYRITEYRQRLSKLVQAITYLLSKKPRAKIFLKGPHVFASEKFGAKLAQFYRDIMFTEFRGLMNDVVYLDVWDITVAHNSENLHPDGQSFNSHIQQFMSFICY